MTFSSMYQGVGAWLSGDGPDNDIVISSRVRLARNVAGFSFFTQAKSAEQTEVLNFVRNNIMATQLKDRLSYVEVDRATGLDCQLLRERHLISKELAESEGSRGVALTNDETLALMINEEDHLRIQVMASGQQLYQTYDRIKQIDDILAEKIEYAFSARYGYLTACPTNVGTGIRVSVMMHLPGLKMTGEIECAFRAAKDMRLAVRGLYGEGSDPIGDFFQISNQTTLGKTEEQIIKELIENAVEPTIEYERLARKKLLKDRLIALDDKICRAQGILSHAHLISSEEALYMLSYIRLGIHMGRVHDIPISIVNKLFLLTKPAHLQKIYGRDLDANARDRARAEFIRKQFTAL